MVIPTDIMPRPCSDVVKPCVPSGICLIIIHPLLMFSNLNTCISQAVAIMFDFEEDDIREIW